MRKGFTLIELLAVIVILAIIALIATPIVLNIINDSRESSTLRSADFYLDAVEYTIANAVLYEGGLENGDYPIDNNGNLCMVALTSGTCPEDKTLTVEVNGEKPSSGTITIENGNIKDISINLNNKTIVKNSDGELVYQEAPTGPTLASLCEFKEGTEKAIGAKYECNFGAGAKNFYILELGSNKVEGSLLKDDEVALILEGNYDTTTQAWCDPNGANPSDNVCAADGLTSKLNEIATAWKELDAEQIVLPSALQVATADGKVYTDYPTISSANDWLYNWTNAAWGDTVSGYWTSTPHAENSISAWRVNYSGLVYDNDVDGDGVEEINYYGVRPVINLKL